MSSILNIGTRALMANQLALQTAGNNIANVNTPGYSRQSVTLENVAGQFSGSGYYGNGVEIVTVARSHSEFLTRQATLSSSVAASDTKRLSQLKQLEDIFQGGTTGLGASVSDMLNSFSDIVSSPTDVTARTVALSRADEMASRFRAAASQLDNLKSGVQTELKSSVDSINSLAERIASVNGEISRALNSGQPPNDLLDQRDQLIKELNQHVQTTSIPADDGTLGIFLAGSQSLVLGTSTSKVSLVQDEFGDPAKSKLAIQQGKASVVLEEATLGGGAIAGMLRFQNSDLVDAANLLGRMALAIGTAVNDQQTLGLDLKGEKGSNLFSLTAMPDGIKATTNQGSATLGVSIQTSPTSGTTALAASNYEISFNDATTGTIKRLSDGVTTNFSGFSSTSPIKIDGLDIAINNTGTPAGGDRFLITPFKDAASSISTAFASASGLAMASPVSGTMASDNKGTLATSTLTAQQDNANLTEEVTLTFDGAGKFSVTGTGTGTPTGVSYTPGEPISYNGWSVTLIGTPQAGDVFTIKANAYAAQDAGNAQAMMDLRGMAMFDGAALTDGYAGAMSEIGVRVQSAGYAAAVSESIALNMEKDRTSVSGVNLDEEAAKLLQFQQAYQSSAKMLQISQSIFDTLMQTVAR